MGKPIMEQLSSLAMRAACAVQDKNSKSQTRTFHKVQSNGAIPAC